MTRRLLFLVLVAALATSACDDGTEAGASAEVTVMTRNIYLGADIFKLTQAQAAEDLPVIAAEIFATMEVNDFPERAGALAAEIEAINPHLVGLQEVELYRVQDPSDYVTGNTSVNASEVHIDFLQVLLDSLEARGLDYTVASQVQNADVELPVAKSQTEFFDVRLTDHDVILARSDVGTANAAGDGYDITVHYTLASGTDVEFARGYTWLDATVDDVTFTFVNTHLEVSGGGQLEYFQNKQADELIGRIGDATPVIAVGDFNTGPGDGPYDRLTGTFTDAWTQVGTGGGGLSCCQPEVLTQIGDFSERIDLILYAGNVEVLSAEVVGDQLADRTASGLWPADHAGVVATLRIEN